MMNTANEPFTIQGETYHSERAKTKKGGYEVYFAFTLLVKNDET